MAGGLLLGGRGVDGHHHAGAHTLRGGVGDEPAHGAPGGTAQLAEQLAAMKEVGLEELGDREDPQTVPYRLDDVFAHEYAEDRFPLGSGRRAEATMRTGEGQQVLAPGTRSSHRPLTSSERSSTRQ